MTLFRHGAHLSDEPFQITSLALKIAPGSPSIWPDWIVSTVEFLSSRGTPTEMVLDLLSIVAEEVETADLIGASK